MLKGQAKVSSLFPSRIIDMCLNTDDHIYLIPMQTIEMIG